MIASWLVVSVLVAASDDGISVDKAAAVQHDQAKAQAEVQKRYGNRPPNEMSREERGELARDRAKAEQQVLEKHDVDGKAWVMHNAKQSKEEKQQQNEKAKGLADKEAKEAAAAKPEAPKEVIVQKGFGEGAEQPGNGEPVVEKGLPGDANAPEEQPRGGKGADSAARPPSASGKGGGGRRSR